MPSKTWRDVPGFLGYRVCSDGAIRGPRGWLLKPYRRATGYERVTLYDAALKRHKIFVHRVVLLAFCGPQPSPDHEADHIDMVRNNNRAENLRWLPKLANIARRPAYV